MEIDILLQKSLCLMVSVVLSLNWRIIIKSVEKGLMNDMAIRMYLKILVLELREAFLLEILL